MEPQTQVYTDVPWADLISQLPTVPLVSVALGFILILVLAFALLGIAFVSAVHGGGKTQKLRQLEAEESRTFQDLQRGFRRMHERVDSLETLFIGRSQAELHDQEC